MNRIFTAKEAIEYVKTTHGIVLTRYKLTQLVKESVIPMRLDPLDERVYQIRQEDLDAWVNNLHPQRPDMSRFDEMKLMMRLNSEEDAETKYFLYQAPEPYESLLHFVVADWVDIKCDIVISVRDAIKLGLIQKE